MKTEGVSCAGACFRFGRELPPPLRFRDDTDMCKCEPQGFADLCIAFEQTRGEHPGVGLCRETVGEFLPVKDRPATARPPYNRNISAFTVCNVNIAAFLKVSDGD